MNYNDIAAMLAAGKTSEEIAKEFTDALNKAEAERKAADEAKAKEDAKSKKLDEISMAIAHALNEYAVVAGIDGEKLRGAEVRELLDKVMPFMDWLKNIDIKVSTNATTATPKVMTLSDADKAIAKWLKMFNW